MCIAILNLKGKLPDSYIKESYKSNKDGSGIIFPLNNRLVGFKQLGGYDKILDKYKEVRAAHPEIPIALHFRIATSGGVNLENCHPFINKELNLGVIHNGVIGWTGKYWNKYQNSDTHFFAHVALNTYFDYSKWLFSKNAVQREKAVNKFEKLVGSYNKIVILNPQGRWVILNESGGHWDDKKENWFSNHSYKSYTRSTCTTYGDWDNGVWRRRNGENIYTDEYCPCGQQLVKYEKDLYHGYCHDCYVRELRELGYDYPVNGIDEKSKNSSYEGSVRVCCGKCKSFVDGSKALTSVNSVKAPYTYCGKCFEKMFVEIASKDPNLRFVRSDKYFGRFDWTDIIKVSTISKMFGSGVTSYSYHGITINNPLHLSKGKIKSIKETAEGTLKNETDNIE